MPVLALTLAVLLPLQDPQDTDRIDPLIRDLGSEDFQTRETADKELRRIGEPAVPALEKAAQDEDAERAIRARAILNHIRGKAEQAERPSPEKQRNPFGTTLEYRDPIRGITFRMDPEGRVELTVPEEDPATGKKEYRTYRAESLEEFKQKHPDVAEKHHIERYVPRIWKPDRLDRELERWLKDWDDPFGSLEERFEEERRRLDELLKRWREDPDPPPEKDEREDPFGSIDKWFEEQRKRLDDMFRKREEKPAVPPPKFGTKLEPVDDELRSRLSLGEREGVVVREVEARSTAEKSGVRRGDVLVKLDGTTIEDRWQFRGKIGGMLASPEFTLEIVRDGERKTLTVRPLAGEKR